MHPRESLGSSDREQDSEIPFNGGPGPPDGSSSAFMTLAKGFKDAREDSDRGRRGAAGHRHL
jgi:hypothetical protein